MKKLMLAPLALIALLLALLAPLAPATAAASGWNDGKSDSDLLWNCVTETYGTGVSANTGWWSPTGQVPKVGEPFMIRGYIGYIGTPCADKVAVVPELIAPAGLEYIDEEVRWDIAPAGEAPQLTTGGLDYWSGTNGGAVLTLAGDKPFILKRGEVLEFQFPVRATREMLGSGTQQPECDDRVAGDAPCPVAQSGDHFQIAFAVGGHGGTKSYVIPYVGLFAAKAGTTPPAGPVAKVPSTTTAKYALKTGKRGKAVVTVSSDQVPTGDVVVTDKGKVVAKARLVAGQRGKLTIMLPKMRRGTHKLAVKYLGSDQVKPSSSATKKVTLR
ncbi:Ig-like domain-containing protein [Nocardioides sp.]|uniref:Ig-like domain-containing protein n=1 Tax=Nocardioides sp. TaxID=35761 RepID=UPI001A317A46|nr:Ig-like domain-containing protein [Nocardioides sp.]MBJ7357838.1 Ig-like domain repeat protein [Nocardioides sp.]